MPHKDGVGCLFEYYIDSLHLHDHLKSAHLRKREMETKGRVFLTVRVIFLFLLSNFYLAARLRYEAGCLKRKYCRKELIKSQLLYKRLSEQNQKYFMCDEYQPYAG